MYLTNKGDALFQGTRFEPKLRSSELLLVLVVVLVLEWRI
jgi:hypothetical protein